MNITDGDFLLQLENPKTIYSGLLDEMLATWGISWLELVVYGIRVLA